MGPVPPSQPHNHYHVQACRSLCLCGHCLLSGCSHPGLCWRSSVRRWIPRCLCCWICCCPSCLCRCPSCPCYPSCLCCFPPSSRPDRSPPACRRSPQRLRHWTCQRLPPPSPLLLPLSQLLVLVSPRLPLMAFPQSDRLPRLPSLRTSSSPLSSGDTRLPIKQSNFHNINQS